MARPRTRPRAPLGRTCKRNHPDLWMPAGFTTSGKRTYHCVECIEGPARAHAEAQAAEMLASRKALEDLVNQPTERVPFKPELFRAQL